MIIDGCWYVHGTAMGHCAALVEKTGQSMAMAHWHSDLYSSYFVSRAYRSFALAVGCGIDHKAYSMAYGKPFKKKPALGCGVVRGGIEAEAIPCPLELLKYRKR